MFVQPDALPHTSIHTAGSVHPTVSESFTSSLVNEPVTRFINIAYVQFYRNSSLKLA